MTEVSGGEAGFLYFEGAHGGANALWQRAPASLGLREGIVVQAHSHEKARGGFGGRSVACHASHRLTVTASA